MAEGEQESKLLRRKELLHKKETDSEKVGEQESEFVEKYFTKKKQTAKRLFISHVESQFSFVVAIRTLNLISHLKNHHPKEHIALLRKQ